MSAILATPSSARPRDRAISSIREQIRTGVWQAGDRLPTERELTEAIGVSRETVRAATDELEAQGLIERIKHRGCVVTGSAVTGSAVTRATGSDSNGPRTSAAGSGLGNSLMAQSVMLAMLDVGQAEVRPHTSSGQVSAGCIAAIRRLGMHAVILSHDKLVGPGLDSLVDLRPFGVVVAEAQAKCMSLPDLADKLSAAKIQLVQVGGDPDETSWPVVASDHHLGGRWLAERLLGRGCRRLIWVGSPALDCHWVRARIDGASIVCGEAGLEAPEAVRVRGFEGRAKSADEFDSIARAFAGHLFDRLDDPDTGHGSRPIGILAANDIEAALTRRACRLLGKTPGRDVLIAGYDHTHAHLPERQYEPEPPCFTVDKLNAELGSAAIDTLMSAPPAPSTPSNHRLEPRLIEGDQVTPTESFKAQAD